MNEATFIRAAELFDHEQRCKHEAGHAAAALLLGLKVTSVRAGFYTASEVRDGNPDDAAGETCFEGTTADHREMALTILCGPLAEGKTAYWPPRNPWSLVPLTPDERQVGEHVQALDLDQAGYDELCHEARALTETPVFKTLHRYLVRSLTEPPHTIGAAEAWHLKTLAETADMEHKQMEATTIGTTEDQGTFTAIAAAYSIDRVNDQIIQGAFANTIERWQASGKMLPLHWNHDGNASNVIGTIDPATMHETDQGLQVSGKLDIHDSETAREAWRSMRNNAMSLSFGYLTTKSRKRADGVNELQEIDLFEVSIVPSPANPDTRVLSMKSADGAIDPNLECIRAEYAGLMTNLLAGTTPTGNPTKALDIKRLERELTPIQIESFPC